MSYKYHVSINISVPFISGLRQCTLWKCKCTPIRNAKLLWMTSHYGPTVIRSVTEIPFHVFILIAHYISGGIFTWSYILWHPPHSDIIFDQQATTAVVHLCTKFELCSCNRSIDMTGVPKFEMITCAPDPWPFESKTNRLWQTAYTRELEYLIQICSVYTIPFRGLISPNRTNRQTDRRHHSVTRFPMRTTV